jgi:hypothetical protein
MLDYMRQALAIDTPCLQAPEQEKLQHRIRAALRDPWTFDEEERLRTARRFLWPGVPVQREEDQSLSERSALGRYLRSRGTWGQEQNLTGPEGEALLEVLLRSLCGGGFLIRGEDRGGAFVQLRADALLWRRGEGAPLPPDPLRSRWLPAVAAADRARPVNPFFRGFYVQMAQSLRDLEAREHTAQIRSEEREKREEDFRQGRLACLFCSPTMELGIDIGDLNVVHLRNVPPTPANYAQRSGRAGRSGQSALIFTYCTIGSGHDQYYFRQRPAMVAGAVAPPRLDLSNEDLLQAHLHALWLAATGRPLGRSLTELLDLTQENYPLREEVRLALTLTESAWSACHAAAQRLLPTDHDDLAARDWYTPEWLEWTLRDAPAAFDRALNRWRELYRSADQQWEEANRKLRFPVPDRAEREAAERQRWEAERQRNLLCNLATAPARR